MKILEDGRLAVIDIQNDFRIYDLNDFELKDGFKSKLPDNILYINNMAISSDGKYLSFYNKEKKEATVFDNESRSFKHRISAHPGGVETVEFTRDNKYFITGGMEGRLYMWSVATGKKVDTLSHHYDAITAIASNEDGRWIATAGYDKVIKVFNRSFRKNHYKLISHQDPVTTVTFLSSQRLLSTDKEGNILIWDVIKANVIGRLTKFNAHITAVCVDAEEKFLFVAGLGGMVGLYNLAEQKLLKIDFLKQLAGISQMAYCNERNLLIFGLSNGQIPIYELNTQKELFVQHIRNKEFHECYLLAEENPLLEYSEEYENLEMLFQKFYEQAKILLKSQKTQEAQELLKHFRSSSTKRLIIQKLFNDFALFNTFQKAVLGKKYMMAYSLANEYSTLKETVEYKKMEDEWHKILLVVRRIINDASSEDKIKQLFKPFMGIPGKSLIIKSLYTNRHVFVLFQKYLSTKDYFNSFKLLKGHPFLEELEEYTKLIRIGQILKDKTLETFNSGGYYDAVKLCDILGYFPAHKEFSEGLKGKANIYAETMQYFAEEKFSAVYNMIEEHAYLEDAKIVVDIEKEFLKYYEKAENYAASGNTAAVKTVMERFSKIKSKIPAILHLVKISYWAQIEEAALQKVTDATLQEAYAQYQKVFGYESALEDLLKTIQQRRALKVSFNVSDRKEYKGSLESLANKIIV